MRDNHSSAVLFCAAQCVNKKVVRVLVDRGADLDVKDHGGCTALHLVALHQNEPLVRLLVNDWSGCQGEG